MWVERTKEGDLHLYDTNPSLLVNKEVKGVRLPIWFCPELERGCSQEVRDIRIELKD